MSYHKVPQENYPPPGEYHALFIYLFILSFFSHSSCEFSVELIVCDFTAFLVPCHFFFLNFKFHISSTVH